MGSCRNEVMTLDLDLDEDVTYQDLKDCLDSGWSDLEIMEELGLDGLAELHRWYGHHELSREPQALAPPPSLAPAPSRVKRSDLQIPKVKQAAAGGKSEARKSKKSSSAPKRKKPGQAAAARLKLDQRISQAYERGVGGHTIVKEMGLCRARVYAGLKRQGVDLRSPADSREASEVRAARIAGEYTSGATLAGLAREYGVGVDAIRSLLAAQGVQLRTTIHHQQALLRAQERERVVERRWAIERAGVSAMIDAGASVDEIAIWTQMKMHKIIKLLDKA